MSPVPLPISTGWAVGLQGGGSASAAELGVHGYILWWGRGSSCRGYSVHSWAPGGVSCVRTSRSLLLKGRVSVLMICDCIEVSVGINGSVYIEGGYVTVELCVWMFLFLGWGVTSKISGSPGRCNSLCFGVECDHETCLGLLGGISE